MEPPASEEPIPLSQNTYNQILIPEQTGPSQEGMHNGHISAELDFALVWPDTEDLYENLMSSDPLSQWQLPLGQLSMATNASFGPTSTPFDRGPSIGPIPSGETHQAVHNVSEMVTALVRFPG
jgi:hypothetical protein